MTPAVVVAKAMVPPPSPALALSPEAKKTVELLKSLGTGDVVHTGGETFLSHLVGVYRVLKSWGCPEALCLAGLAHSVYATEGFQGFSLECTPQNRARVASVLGSLEAEKIAHVFCCTDRGSQDRDLFLSEEEGTEKEREHRWRVRKGAPLAAAPVAAAPSCSSTSSSPLFVPGKGPEDPYPGGEIALGHDEWLQFTTLTLADWMEQVESAALMESEHFGCGRGFWVVLLFRFFFLRLPVFFFTLARSSPKKLKKKKQLGRRPGLGLQAEGLRGDGPGRGRSRGPDARGGDGEGARGGKQRF